jgi:two-component system chemotaxis sensor kinase CheA
LSTTREVTELSGRGVGMDVVKRTIEALRGTVSVESREGEGTTVRMRLPLTVAIIDGLAVTARDETYILPLDAVAECFEHASPERGRARGVLDLRGQALPYFRLRDLFHLDGPAHERESVVVLRHDRGQVALTVDELVGVREVVVKPAGQLVGEVAGLLGSTILATGRVAFILDIPGLVRMATRAFGGAAQPVEG